jgi:hypothetical protein
MPQVNEATEFTLVLAQDERALLLEFLEEALRDTHVEARRTEAPAYQEKVHHRERVLRSLVERLRGA